MPVTIRKLKNGKYRVSTPNQVHARGTTMAKAQAIKRIIEQAEGKKRHKALHEYV
ncbi:MAG TPA: hypothetical protein VN812_10440 [Candidatus Acidoferrales bacterium]|nr:hypothetical protein [Candidatus Acidoferrales bacterium]